MLEPKIIAISKTKAIIITIITTLVSGISVNSPYRCKIYMDFAVVKITKTGMVYHAAPLSAEPCQISLSILA